MQALSHSQQQQARERYTQMELPELRQYVRVFEEPHTPQGRERLRIMQEVIQIKEQEGGVQG